MLEETILAAAAGAGVPLPGAESPSRSPNEKLGVAVIGVRGRGAGHVAAFKARNDCQVRIVCDADRDVGMHAAARVGGGCYITPGGKNEVVTALYTVQDGVIVIPKKTVIPPGTRI